MPRSYPEFLLASSRLGQRLQGSARPGWLHKLPTTQIALDPCQRPLVQKSYPTSALQPHRGLRSQAGTLPTPAPDSAGPDDPALTPRLTGLGLCSRSFPDTTATSAF